MIPAKNKVDDSIQNEAGLLKVLKKCLTEINPVFHTGFIALRGNLLAQKLKK